MPVPRVDSQNSKRFVGPWDSRPDLDMQMGRQLDPRPHRDFSVGNYPSHPDPPRWARLESVGPLTDPASGGSLDQAGSALPNRVHPQDPMGSRAVAHLAVEGGGEDPRCGASGGLWCVRLGLVHRARSTVRRFEGSAWGSGGRKGGRLSEYAEELPRSHENPRPESATRREIKERERPVDVVRQEPASRRKRRPCLPILERLPGIAVVAVVQEAIQGSKGPHGSAKRRRATPDGEHDELPTVDGRGFPREVTGLGGDVHAPESAVSVRLQRIEDDPSGRSVGDPGLEKSSGSRGPDEPA